MIVRDIPIAEPEELVAAVGELRSEGLACRLAYLDPGAAAFAEAAAFHGETFTTKIEQAEEWRNDRDVTDLIILVARGDEAKLTSFQDFDPITTRELKDVLANRALAEQAGQNEVQSRWWRMIREDERMSFGQSLDYYRALHELSQEDYVAHAGEYLYHLGLLPDPGFFDDPSESVLRRRLARNREFVRRVQTLTEQDRRLIATNIRAETDTAVRQRLNDSLRLIKQIRWSGGGWANLSLGRAEELVKTRSRRPDPDGDGGGGRGKARPLDLSAVAAEALLEVPDDSTEQAQIVEDVQAQLDEIPDTQLRPVKVSVELGLARAEVEARSDVLNLMAKVIGDGRYGGLVTSTAVDIDDMLRRFRPGTDLVHPWSREELERFFASFTATAAGRELEERFRVYDAARTALLPHARLLCVAPLTVAAEPNARERLLAAITAYDDLFEQIHSGYAELFNEFGQDAHELIAHLLALETVVLRHDELCYAILAPTHPLYLWHYAEYCRLVAEQRDLLSDLDRELVLKAAGNLPNFLASLCVPHLAADTSEALPFLGRLGPLPYYGRHAETSAGMDGLGLIGDLLKAFVAFHPPARTGLRVGFIDPPDAGPLLTRLTDLADADVITGASLVAAHHPHRSLGVELRMSEEEEERVAQRFHALSNSRRFVFAMEAVATHGLTPRHGWQSHCVVAFDQTPGSRARVQPVSVPIQPLALTRRLRYRPVRQSVELEPAPGGIFASYDRVVEHFDSSARVQYFAVHQEGELRQKLAELAAAVPWLVIADRHVDRDLSLGAVRLFTGREGERDVAAFAQSPDVFRRPLRDVARDYNTAIRDDELDDLLRQLADLLDAGVLALRPDALGRTNHNAVKGLLGTLIAARWYRQQASTSGRRLLVSLDGAEARRWLQLSDDPRRADLLGFDATDKSCTIDVIEVKAVDQATSEYTVVDGQISGPSVGQMLSIRRLLKEVFTPERENELMTTPARRELIREHIYRELSKQGYTAGDRQAWVEMSERLFAGQIPTTLQCMLIDVRLGVHAGALETRECRAQDGEDLIPTTVVQLNETGVEALRRRETPPEVDDDVDDDDIEDPPRSEEGPHGPVPDSPPSPEEAQVEPAAERPPREARPVEPEIARPRAYLGEAPGTYGRPRDVWFDPSLPERALPNPHVAITGETGSGKTQATKAMIHDFREAGLPILVLDFKDDYVQRSFAKNEGFVVHDATFGGLPFNPMVPSLDTQSGFVAPMNHVHQLGEIIKRIYDLGDQQAYRLREAMKQAYESQQISMRPFEPTADTGFPPFDDVRGILAEDRQNEALLGRLSPIFDLGLFTSESAEGEFDALARGSAVIRLSQLPGDQVKNAVAEFFLMALYNYLIRLPHPHALQRLLILDEAWRLVESPFLEPLMREGRAFGLGVIIATQFPRDLPDTVSGSTATKLFFSQTKSEQVREIQRTLVGKTSGADADHIANQLRSLPPLTCILQNSQYAPWVRLAIRPYFERVTDEPEVGGAA